VSQRELVASSCRVLTTVTLLGGHVVLAVDLRRETSAGGGSEFEDLRQGSADRVRADPDVCSRVQDPEGLSELGWNQLASLSTGSVAPPEPSRSSSQHLVIEWSVSISTRSSPQAECQGPPPRSGHSLRLSEWTDDSPQDLRVRCRNGSRKHRPSVGRQARSWCTQSHVFNYDLFDRNHRRLPDGDRILFDPSWPGIHGRQWYAGGHLDRGICSNRRCFGVLDVPVDDWYQTFDHAARFMTEYAASTIPTALRPQ